MKINHSFLLYLLITLGFSQISEAQSGFEDSRYIHAACVESFSLPENYGPGEVQTQVHSRFKLHNRLLCLVPLLIAKVDAQIAYFEQLGFYSQTVNRPLLLQLFEGFTGARGAEIDLEEAELRLNKLVAQLWLLQMLPKVPGMAEVGTLAGIPSHAGRLASLSLVSSYGPFLYNLSEVRSSIDALSIDDSILSRINDRNIQELVCVLNPARPFCPERILFASDIRNISDFYIVVQKVLRDSSMYFGAKKVENSGAKDFCHQLANAAKALSSILPTLLCPAEGKKFGSTVSSYLESIENLDQYFALAISFNWQRIANSLPEAQGSKAQMLTKIIYLKDLQTSLDEFEMYQASKMPDPQVMAKIKNEINSVLREDLDEK